MKGFEIKRENEKPIYLFNRFDVVSAIAHAIYYTANPESGTGGKCRICRRSDEQAAA